MKLKTALKKRATTLAIWAMVAVLAAVAVTWLPHAGTETPPEVEFVLLDGRKISLSALRGRPVLVSFWATSCPPCVEELPDLLRLYRDLHPQGFELIAVAAPYDPPTRVQTFAADHALPYPDVGRLPVPVPERQHIFQKHVHDCIPPLESPLQCVGSSAVIRYS